MQHQEYNNWCWAAVTVSVANFYSKKDTWKQCNLANQSFNRTDCCNGSGCNKDHTFDAALRLTRNYRDQVPPLPFEDIMKEINTGRPIVIRLMPRVGEIGHAVVITGYNNDHPDKPKIKIQNPDYWFSSDTVCDFDTFPESLGLFAETLWSYCCLTEPSSSKSEMNGALVSS